MDYVNRRFSFGNKCREAPRVPFRSQGYKNPKGTAHRPSPTGIHLVRRAGQNVQYSNIVHRCAMTWYTVFRTLFVNLFVKNFINKFSMRLMICATRHRRKPGAVADEHCSPLRYFLNRGRRECIHAFRCGQLRRGGADESAPYGGF